MIEIGVFNTLRIDRITSPGFYLVDDESKEDILLPRKYITDEMEEDGDVEVFVYKDSQDRPVATTERPYALVGEFAALEVAQVNDIGAFLDWGLTEKELLVPYQNQAKKMRVGEMHMVYIYEDEKTKRLVATSKLTKYLKKVVEPEQYEYRQEVDLIVRSFSDLGMNVIIDHEFSGLVYTSDLRHRYEVGDYVTGYIRKIREDGKLDISLQPIGALSIEPNADRIMEVLEENDGFLALHDKSDPDDIRRELGISKKLFKKSVGTLYKKKLITIEEGGIKLVKEV